MGWVIAVGMPRVHLLSGHHDPTSSSLLIIVVRPGSISFAQCRSCHCCLVLLRLPSVNVISPFFVMSDDGGGGVGAVLMLVVLAVM
jgi:hypothetical protein